MPVPKKRTSKSKKNSRLSNWTKKANIQAKKALSLAKSILNGEATSFVSHVNDTKSTDQS